jgi:hypothetical protein
VVKHIEGYGLQGTAQVPAQLDDRDDEQLVAVRRAVLNDVEHAVGNLLQRMHHVARAATAGLGAQGERLQGALDDLERLLELFFDYVSPVDVQVRPTDAQRIAESLAGQLRSQGVGDVTLVPPSDDAPTVQVLADPRVLSRSFALLAQACARECDGGAAVTTEMVHDPATGDRVQFLVQSAAETAAAPTPQGALAAAVAGRLIELQGGELHARPRPACACAVILPTVS